MDIAEVLKLADKIVFAKTGKHLDYLQEAILRGTLQQRTYTEIAEEVYSSTSHVRNVGSELWQILSEGLGKDVSKASCKAILKKKGDFYNFSSFIGGIVGDFASINHLNICTEPSLSPTDTQQTESTLDKLHLDLGDAPEIFSFYDRTSELATLERWIIQERCRFVALLGISGIGKTAIAIRLIDEIKTHFDYIIYRSLRFSPSLNATLTNLLQIFCQPAEISDSVEAQLSQLLNYLRQSRCLIVLDDVQAIFSSGQLAGHYKSGCEEYHHFFQLIAEVSHNSCVMVVNWEKPKEVAKLERENHPVRSLCLGSLGAAAKEILREYELADEEAWDTLIDTYQGNPLWLALTASLIQDLFGGRVAEFLQYEGLILSEALRSQLEQQFQRLTALEQAVMAQLASETAPVALLHLSQTSRFSPFELVDAMQSLKMRFLVDAKEQKKVTLFSLNPVLKQYVKIRYF